MVRRRRATTQAAYQQTQRRAYYGQVDSGRAGERARGTLKLEEHHLSGRGQETRFGDRRTYAGRYPLNQREL